MEVKTMKALRTVVIQVASKGLMEKIPVVQADSGRSIDFVITDMTIPTGAAARLYALKPDKTEVYNNCVINNKVISVDLTTQILAVVGKVSCQVQIVSENDIVTTFEFSLVVDRNIISNSAIESKDEFMALMEAINEVEELKTKNIETIPITFTQAAVRENINTGEIFSTILGKIKKYFADLKAVAFTGDYSDLSNTPIIGNAASQAVADNLTTAVSGSVLDARQGKVLNDKITVVDTTVSEINDNLTPVVLYENWSGTTAANLSDNITNYGKLEIQLVRGAAQAFFSTICIGPKAGQVHAVNTNYYLGNILRFYSALLTLADNKITLGSEYYYNFGAESGNGSGFVITKVVGYKI